jgi:hypothetical protein
VVKVAITSTALAWATITFRAAASVLVELRFTPAIATGLRPWRARAIWLERSPSSP